MRPAEKLVLPICLLMTVSLARGSATDPTDLSEPLASPSPQATQPAPISAEPAAGNAGPDLPKSQTPEYIDRFVKYYLEMYEKHLRSEDWIARSMGVISLTRIDDPRTTARIFQVLRDDKFLAVRVYAWEALHARQDRLSPEDRAKWVQAGFELAKKDALCGDMRLGLLGLVREQGPTARNKEIFRKLFLNTNSMDPCDIRTLWAMGDMLKEWQSPDLVQGLIAALADVNTAYRAEVILQRLDDNVPPSAPLRRLGSLLMWTKTQDAWKAWFQKANLKEVPLDQVKPYKELSDLMPHGEKIKDTAEAAWRQDLELGRFRLDQLDVGFAIDSTGSMGATVRWIQSDVSKIMRAFELISRQPRIGILLYRDYGDEYLVKPIPLSNSSQALTKALKEAGAAGGGDIPEAIYEALSTLVDKQQWSKQEDARKVVILVGDAPPKEDSLEKIETLVKTAADKGFVFYTFKVRTKYERIQKLPNYDPELTTFDKIAQWGKGRSFWVDFEEEQRSSRDLGTASPPSQTAPQRVMFREVLNAAMGHDYLDRLDPFLNVLLQYVNRPVEEQRLSFPPEPVHGGGRPHRPDDPQKQSKGK